MGASAKRVRACTYASDGGAYEAAPLFLIAQQLHALDQFEALCISPMATPAFALTVEDVLEKLY